MLRNMPYSRLAEAWHGMACGAGRGAHQLARLVAKELAEDPAWKGDQGQKAGFTKGQKQSACCFMGICCEGVQVHQVMTGTLGQGQPTSNMQPTCWSSG